MLYRFLILVGLILCLPYASARAQTAQATATPVPVVILAPLPGQALQGNVSISGTSAIAGFRSAELDFGYSGDATNTWFLISESDQPVENGVLAQWDTTTLTDGVYTLRLVVSLEDGSQIIASVAGVRIRNYTAIETDTPTPVTPTATQVPGETPLPSETATPKPTPIPATATPLPPNPAQISARDITGSLGKGALAALGIFALVGLYRITKGIRGRG